MLGRHALTVAWINCIVTGRVTDRLLKRTRAFLFAASSLIYDVGDLTTAAARINRPLPADPRNAGIDLPDRADSCMSVEAHAALQAARTIAFAAFASLLM